MSNYSDYICTIIKAGPSVAQSGDASVVIRLKDTEGTFESWFSASNVIQNEILAVALTAINLQAEVQVRLESTDQYSKILFMYLIG